jgi:hypothetical protein
LPTLPTLPRLPTLTIAPASSHDPDDCARLACGLI